MKKIIVAFFTVLLISGIMNGQENIKFDGKNYYFSNKIIIQFAKEIPTDLTGAALLPVDFEKRTASFGITKVTKICNVKNNLVKAASKLNKIYVMEFNSNLDPVFVSAKLSKLKDVIFSEPYYLSEASYIPNDPSFSAQYALNKINAAGAWDINKGNANVIIGIVDTGVDWDHPDLAANVWTNTGEIPNNLIDDDNNGYVDDVRGWDFGGLVGVPDNDPMEDRPDHGTLVAGAASAVTDNGVGISGIGFNCKVMPVKTSRDDNRTNTGRALISYGYQGIIYAVDNGASVINCSWGNYAYSIFAKTVIDYANANNVLVVAAMGNDNRDEAMYPAFYKGVLSVAASSVDDVRSSFSNYGYNVDVTAPGTGVLSTWMDNTYSTASGTSISSPIVAGLCGLVKAQFPLYTASQIGEQVRANCDDISSVNPSYINKLGKGRINAFTSLTNTDAKSVRIENVQYIDNGDGDGVFEPGENILVKIDFVNFLAPLATINISLSSSSNYVTIVNGNFSANSMGTLEIFDNNSNKFSFNVANNAPQNTTVDLFLTYTEGSYTDFEAISVLVNPTFATQGINNVALTITNKGTFGFNDYPNNTQGDGFFINGGGSLLFEGGLMYGTSANKLVDGIRDTTGNAQNSDFRNITPFLLSIPGDYAEEQGMLVMNDDYAGTNKLGISTKLDSYSFTEEPYDNFILLKYLFTNTSLIDVNGFYAGLFFDWDIDENTSAANYASYDQVTKCSLFYNSDSSICTAVGLAWWWGYDGFYAIQNDGDDGGINIYDGFTKAEKWLSLTNGLNKVTAGLQDISGVNSAGPFNIPSGSEREIAFVVAAGNSLDMVRQAIVLGREKYAMLPTDVNNEETTKPISFELQQNYPNPFNPVTNIKYSIPEAGFVTIKIYDIMGQEVTTLINTQMNAGNYQYSFNASNLASGVYFYRLQAGKFSETKKLILLK